MNKKVVIMNISFDNFYFSLVDDEQTTCQHI